jgi:hypothetical protein
MLTLMVNGQRVPDWQGSWVYLGQDFLKLRGYEQTLPADKRVSLSESIEKAVELWRREFVGWIASLGERAGWSEAWWMTSLSGHSVTTSSLFLNFCQLSSLEAAGWFHPSAPDLLVICDDWFLLRCIEGNARLRSVPSNRAAGWFARRINDGGRLALRWVARWVKGGAVALAEMWAAKITAPREEPLSTKPVFLVRTEVDDANLKDDGSFSDRYFPGLASWLREQNESVLTIPVALNSRRSRTSLARWFRTSPEPFLLLEQYAIWSDILRGALTVFKAVKVFPRSSSFRGFSLETLLRREAWTDSSATGRIRFLVAGSGLRRWLSNGGRCAALIDAFENMPCERPLLKALRQAAPNAAEIGYQHIGGIPREMLAFCLDPRERENGLFPKRIVANSFETARQMEKDGVGCAPLPIGPALRYRYLTTSELPDPVEPPSSQQLGLLVLLPLDLASAVELLSVLLELRSRIAELELCVRLKSHPMCPRQRLADAVKRSDWPEGWIWVDGTVQQHFGATAMVLGYGSALFDAAASAVPFVSLRRETGLTLNPLAPWDDSPLCRNYSRDQFLRMLTDTAALKGGGPGLTERRELACRIRRGLGQFNDQAWRAFLPNGS